MEAGFGTVAEAFAHTATRNPNAECIKVPRRPSRDYLPNGLSLSYGQVWAEAQEIAAAYTAAGYGHRHRVALSMGNRPDFFLHWLALNSIGASAVPINPDYREQEIRWATEVSDAVLTVALSEHAGIISNALRRSPHTPVITTDNFSELPHASRPAAEDPPGRQSEAGLLFTSGTTGLPKGCMLSNEAFLFNGQRYVDAGGLMELVQGHERLYNPLPVYYANAFAITNVAMILAAGCMIFPDRFHARSFWQEVIETGATIVHHLGLIPSALLAQPHSVLERAHRVKFSGGAGVDPAQRQELEERFGIPFIEFFGMSEVGICAGTNYGPRHPNTRCVGQPWAEVELRIVGENDDEMPVGEPGELIIRRSGDDPRRGFFSGYLNEPEVTEAAWRNGWFHTGDLASRGADGCYYFVDRSKHMIRRSGQNISPGEIETVIGSHPSVAEIAALPAPDDLRQEEVLIAVVPKPEANPSRELAESLVRWSLDKLAYFKAPGWILFVESLPKTSTQKTQKSLIFSKNEDPRCRVDIYDVRSMKGRQ